MLAYFSNLPSADAVALTFDEIAAARAVSADGYTVVAALPLAIYTRSQRNSLKEEIRRTVAEALQIPEDRVLVTFDGEIYRMLDDNFDEKALVELVKYRG